MNSFPYIDTLKITEKFGPGSQFYGFGSAEELDDLEQRLEGGERFNVLFTEFPGNPLLRSPDLERIRQLADKYDFYVVVDETIGNFINVNVLPYADVVVSSLTKVFSGDSNVMGGGYVCYGTQQFKCQPLTPAQPCSQPQEPELPATKAHLGRRLRRQPLG
jgi:cystathionine gamma-synthase